MMSLTYINARFASIQTGITHIHIDIHNIYTYLETLATHTVSSLLLHPSNLREMFENIKQGVRQCPWLALPNDP